MLQAGATLPGCTGIPGYRTDTGDHKCSISSSAQSGLRRDHDESSVSNNAEGTQEKSSQGISTSSHPQLQLKAEDMDVIDNSYSKLDYQINTKVLPLTFDDSFLTIAF